MATLSLQRSKQWLERDGWEVAIVERYNQWAHIRQDLWGMADLLAIRPDRSGVTAIQACGEDIPPHIEKLITGWVDIKKGKTYGPNKYLPIWLKAGNPFFIWGWRLRKHEGTRPTYQLRQIEAVLKDGKVEFHEIPDTTELKNGLG
jgi:hypothetical protein